jgi:predicted nucleic acid-binding protein
MAIRKEIVVVASPLVLAETKRNLAESAPEYLVLLDYILENIPFELFQPTKREVVAATRYTALKDAPIVAAARKAKVDFLITLDKKHLLGKPDLAKYVGAEILTPKEAFVRLTR